jgi:hypothetical protein
MDKPNTLDLTHHAELSLNYLTGMTDPRLGYLPYWRVNLEADPPEASHCRPDCSELPGSWVDAIVLARQMTGSKQGVEAEAGLKEMLLSDYGEDGLRYHASLPWCRVKHAVIHEQGYLLNGLVTWYTAEREPRVKETAERLIDGLLATAAHVGKSYTYELVETGTRRYYFPCDCITPDGWDFTMLTGRSKEHIFNGVMILPLVRYFETTGYEPALDLAEGLVNHIVRQHEFGHDGRFIGHFHATMWVVAGILRYGLATNNPQHIELGRKVYDWARDQGSSFGWFPEWVGTTPPEEMDAETCCLADMVELAHMLAESCDDRYWDDVERFARNHLVESQLQGLPPCEHETQKAETQQETYRDVAGRAIGGFAGSSWPNDFMAHGRRFIAGCCGATGARALFLAWDGIVQKRGDTVWVNMPLNRRTPWLDVLSQHPHEGKLRLLIHDAPKLQVRMPEWAGGRVSVHVDGNPVLPEWRGNYLELNGLSRGQEVVVVHALRTDVIAESVAGRNYTVSWRGNTVMRITPPGKNVPLYLRLKTDREAAERAVKRTMI